MQQLQLCPKQRIAQQVQSPPSDRYCVPSSINPSSNPACNPCTAAAATAVASTTPFPAAVAAACSHCCHNQSGAALHTLLPARLKPCNSSKYIQLISCQEGNHVQQCKRTTSLLSEEILRAQLYRPILQPRLQPLHSSRSHRSSIDPPPFPAAVAAACSQCCQFGVALHTLLPARAEAMQQLVLYPTDIMPRGQPCAAKQPHNFPPFRRDTVCPALSTHPPTPPAAPAQQQQPPQQHLRHHSLLL